MAVIDGLPGLEVHVETAGRELPEYPDDLTQIRENASVRYIEATTGNRFYVTLYMDYGYLNYYGDGLKTELILDGRSVGRTSFPRARRQVQREVIAEKTTECRDRIVRHAFTFSELRISEDEPDVFLRGTLAQLGTIKLVVHRFIYRPDRDGPVYLDSYRPNYGPIRRDDFHYRPPPSQAPRPRYANIQTELIRGGIVPEKNLKGSAVSHQSKLTYAWESKPDRFRRPSRAKEVIGDGPLATFTFKYRSRNALQSLLIIPRSVTPTLRGCEDSVNVMSYEEKWRKEAILPHRVRATFPNNIPLGIRFNTVPLGNRFESSAIGIESNRFQTSVARTDGHPLEYSAVGIGRTHVERSDTGVEGNCLEDSAVDVGNNPLEASVAEIWDNGLEVSTADIEAILLENSAVEVEGNRPDCMRLKREHDWDVDMDAEDDEDMVEVMEERPAKVAKLFHEVIDLTGEDDGTLWGVT